MRRTKIKNAKVGWTSILSNNGKYAPVILLFCSLFSGIGRAQNVNDAISIYNEYIRVGNESKLDSAHNLLANLDTGSTGSEEIFYLALFTLEQYVLKLRRDRKNSELCDSTKILIQMVWMNLINREMAYFHSYSWQFDSEDDKKKQFAVFVEYERFLSILIELGIYFDSPDVLYPIAQNTVRRLLAYSTTNDNRIVDEYQPLLSDSLYWSDFYEVMQVEPSNFLFIASLWRGFYPDSPTITESDSSIKEQLSTRLSSSYYYVARERAISNMGIYLSASALGLSLWKEGKLSSSRETKESKFRQAVYYYEEANSIILNLRHEIESILYKTSSDTLIEYRRIFDSIGPETVLDGCLNATEDLAILLEENQKWFEAALTWQKIWMKDDYSETRRKRYANEVYSRFAKMLFRTRGVDLSNDQHKMVLSIYHEVENYLGRFKD